MSPVQRALTALGSAAAESKATSPVGAAGPATSDRPVVIEERSTWQPDSWLIACCWQTLAASGVGRAALDAAQMLAARRPMAPTQALVRLASQVSTYPELAPLLADELRGLHTRLFAGHTGASSAAGELLLSAADCAAAIGDEMLAFACLERLDQTPNAWNQALVQSNLRRLAASAISRLRPHPLVTHLLTNAIRQHDDSGAQFLYEVASALTAADDRVTGPRARLLDRSITAFRTTALTSLHSRRLAAAVFGRIGLVDDVLEQLDIIANVQDARRESGLTQRTSDAPYFRQVVRPKANSDVDFQVYTIQETIRGMPLRHMAREQRITLADRLALLAVRSDGWTAAGAAATLVELGAMKYATDVVEQIRPDDPIRSEGVISLVRALLAAGEATMAQEQVDEAIRWVKSLHSRNPERATIWGLAEAFLDFGQPAPALRLLAQRQESSGLWRRLTRFFRPMVSDDQLRDDRLRLRALLMTPGASLAEVHTLYERLRSWAPRLLDGEALISFLVDGMLEPLFATEHSDLAWGLLPAVQQALTKSSGEKHAMRVQRVADLLASQMTEESSVVRQRAEEFMLNLWHADVDKGIWQTVHSVEGTLPLLLRLEGPDALVELARAAAAVGEGWAA